MINYRIAQDMLRSFQERLASTKHPLDRKLIVRLAALWLSQTVSRDFDILMRLQILEGVAGVPLDTWMSKQRRGLAIAASFFEDKGTLNKIKPEWFSRDDTRMANIVATNLAKRIRSLKLKGVEPLDLIGSYLMGIGVNVNDAQVQRPCYVIGRNKADLILSGRESPQSLAKGFVSRYFINKLTPIWNKERRTVNVPVDGKGRIMDTEDRSHRPEEAFHDSNKLRLVLNEIFFKDLHDPLGKKIRSLMRDTWKGSAPMLLWLDSIEAGHKPLTQSQLAAELGIQPGSIGARHW